MSAATFEDSAASPYPGKIALVMFFVTRTDCCDFDPDGAGNACSQDSGVFHFWQRTYNAKIEIIQYPISLCFANNFGTIIINNSICLTKSLQPESRYI